MIQFSNSNSKIETINHSKNVVGLKKLIVFFIMICASVSLWGQQFIIDGKFTDNRAILLINLEKDSLLILTGKGDEIGGQGGAKYKILKVVSSEVDKEKAIVFALNDYFGNEEFNAVVVLYNRIIWGSLNPTKNSPTISITNLKDEEGYRFDFNEFLVAAEKKIKNTTTTSVSQQPRSTSNAPSTTNSQPPSGKIEKVWLEHNVYKNGEKGMNIHIHFNVNNMKGKICECNAYYNFANEQGSYIMTALERFTPSYENAKYEDFILFAPYKDFEWLINFKLPNSNLKNYDMKIQVTLGEKLPNNWYEKITESDFIRCTYNK